MTGAGILKPFVGGGGGGRWIGLENSYLAKSNSYLQRWN